MDKNCFTMELQAFTMKKPLILVQGAGNCLLLEEDIKSLESKIRPFSWASCIQLCFVSDLHCKPPMGPLGAIAGEACGVAGDMGTVLGLNPGYLGK